jgi:hypothetical protein
LHKENEKDIILEGAKITGNGVVSTQKRKE